jgi:hypothetical protein
LFIPFYAEPKLCFFNRMPRASMNFIAYTNYIECGKANQTILQRLYGISRRHSIEGCDYQAHTDY